jgi:hypothetical protein
MDFAVTSLKRTAVVENPTSRCGSTCQTTWVAVVVENMGSNKTPVRVSESALFRSCLVVVRKGINSKWGSPGLIRTAVTRALQAAIVTCQEKSFGEALGQKVTKL